MRTASSEKFLRAAVAEDGQPVSAGGPPLRLLTGIGMKRKHRRRRKSLAGSTARVVTTNTTSITIDDLVAAKKLVGQIGGIERVKEALVALARLS